MRRVTTVGCVLERGTFDSLRHLVNTDTSKRDRQIDFADNNPIFSKNAHYGDERGRRKGREGVKRDGLPLEPDCLLTLQEGYERESPRSFGEDKNALKPTISQLNAADNLKIPKLK